MTLVLVLAGVWIAFGALAVCLCCVAAEGDRRLVAAGRRGVPGSGGGRSRAATPLAPLARRR